MCKQIIFQVGYIKKNVNGLENTNLEDNNSDDNEQANNETTNNEVANNNTVNNDENITNTQDKKRNFSRRSN